MKLWLKLTIGFVILLVVAGGSLYYYFNIKEYEVADKEIEEITETGYEVKLPDENGNLVSVDPEKTTGTQNNKETGETSTGSDGKNSSDGNSTSSTTNETNPNSSATSGNKSQPAEITVASIKNKYRPAFEDLQNQANGKIDGILSRAIDEYRTKKNKGESISFGYFYQKYSSAAESLEGNTDAAFEIIYNAIQSELKANSFSPKHADDFKEEYEQTKKDRRDSILEKAKELL